MAQPSWAPSRKKGESESDYKKRYYTAQRKDAEKNKSGATYKKLQSKGYEPGGTSSPKPKATENTRLSRGDTFTGSVGKTIGRASAAVTGAMDAPRKVGERLGTAAMKNAKSYSNSGKPMSREAMRIESGGMGGGLASEDPAPKKSQRTGYKTPKPGSPDDTFTGSVARNLGRMFGVGGSDGGSSSSSKKSSSAKMTTAQKSSSSKKKAAS